MTAILKRSSPPSSAAPAGADRPFTGPFVTISVPVPRRPGPYDQAKPDSGRDRR